MLKFIYDTKFKILITSATKSNYTLKQGFILAFIKIKIIFLQL